MDYTKLNTTVNHRVNFRWPVYVAVGFLLAVLLVKGCSYVSSATEVAPPVNPYPAVVTPPHAEELGRQAGRAYENAKDRGQAFIEGFRAGADSK